MLSGEAYEGQGKVKCDSGDGSERKGEQCGESKAALFLDRMYLIMDQMVVIR